MSTQLNTFKAICQSIVDSNYIIRLSNGYNFTTFYTKNVEYLAQNTGTSHTDIISVYRKQNNHLILCGQVMFHCNGAVEFYWENIELSSPLKKLTFK